MSKVSKSILAFLLLAVSSSFSIGQTPSNDKEQSMNPLMELIEAQQELTNLGNHQEAVEIGKAILDIFE